MITMEIMNNRTAQLDSSLQKKMKQKILIIYTIVGNPTMTQDFIFVQVIEKHLILTQLGNFFLHYKLSLFSRTGKKASNGFAFKQNCPRSWISS